jgi:3-oxoacyl-[acyl-carrier protein] reductase
MADELNQTLKHQPILITGASAGIGLACAQALVQAGAEHVILTARQSEKLEAAKARLQSITPVRVDCVVCDHSQRESIAQLLAQFETLGWPAAVVANVGINPVHQHGPKKVHSTGWELCNETLTTNVTNTFYLLAALLQEMRRNRFGRILLMGSQAYQHGIPGQALYNISKSSLLGMKNSIAAEYGGNNILCHLLNPGVVLNERTLKLRKRKPQLAEVHAVTEQEVATAALRLLCEGDTARNAQEINI